MPNNWCFWTVVLDKTLESPLDSKKVQPVHPKGNQSWIFTGRTDAEAETPILWPPDVKNWLIEKTLMLGKIEGRRRGWQRMRWSDGILDSMDMSLSKLWGLVMEGSLVCCIPWGCRELDKTEWLNWTELNWILMYWGGQRVCLGFHRIWQKKLKSWTIFLAYSIYFYIFGWLLIKNNPNKQAYLYFFYLAPTHTF